MSDSIYKSNHSSSSSSPFQQHIFVLFIGYLPGHIIHLCNRHSLIGLSNLYLTTFVRCDCFDRSGRQQSSMSCNFWNRCHLESLCLGRRVRFISINVVLLLSHHSFSLPHSTLFKNGLFRLGYQTIVGNICSKILYIPFLSLFAIVGCQIRPARTFHLKIIFRLNRLF